MKRFALVLLVMMLCLPALADDGNPAMILFNVTMSAFDDCSLYVSPLDQYGRAGAAFAVISRASIDSERRQDISMFTPAAFVNKQYDFIDGKYLYNRCHLIGAQLTSGTACAENLVTGTQYLNIEGMLPIENRVRTYVSRTGEHVMYRAKPVYQGTELIPRAVEITAYSVESIGLRMTAYCYNIQPGVNIDYATGASGAEGEDLVLIGDGLEDPASRSGQPDYVLNVKSMRFHYPWCTGVETMSPKNRQDYYGDRDELISRGYKPCGSCDP